MKKINILIVSHEPLTPTLSQLYCIEELKQSFNIQWISLRSFFHKKTMYFDDELKEEFIDFDKLSKLKKYLKKYPIKNTYIFLENFATSLWALYVNFILRNYKICRFILYRSFWCDLETNYKKTSFVDLLNKKKVVQLIVRKLDRNPDIVFSAGASNSEIKSTKHISINSTVKVDCPDVIATENICVFIDQGWPTHPDFTLHKNTEKIDANKIKEFIDSYNNFFEYIENKLDIKVVIAKHPKSLIPDHYFNNRLIVKNDTTNLIRKSKFVICHDSLIINVAIQYFKPILIIYNNIYMKYEIYYNIIKFLAKILGKNAINIDEYKPHKIPCDRIMYFILPTSFVTNRR